MNRVIASIILTLLIACNAGCLRIEQPNEVSDKNNESVIWAIEPQFAAAGDFSCGVASVITSDGKKGFINKQNEFVIDVDGIGEFSSYSMPTFSYGVARFSQPNNQGELYLPLSGVVISNESIKADRFTAAYTSSNLMPSSEDGTGLFGYINRQKIWYVLPEYVSAQQFRNGYSIASNNEGEFIVSERGDIRKLDERTGVIEFSENLGVGSSFDTRGYRFRYHYVDINGNTILPGPFEGAKSFSEGLAAVKKDGKWGYINRDGEYEISPQFSDAGSFSEGLADIYDDSGRRAFIDVTGNVVIPYHYSGIGYGSFNNGVCLRQKSNNSNKYGLIDKSGKWVVDAQYDWIYTGFICELVKGDKVGVFLPSIGTMIEPKYSKIEIIGETAIVLYDGELSYLFDISSNSLRKNKYYSLTSYSEGLLCAKVDEKGLWGYVDISGGWIIEPQFTEIRPFCTGLAAVRINEKWGYIANPLVYTEWAEDEIERGVSLGLFSYTDNKPAITVGAELESISCLITKLIGSSITPNSIIDVLNLSDHSLTDKQSIITRELASVILASVAEFCGQDIYCLRAFLEDENDVNPEMLLYVTYASVIGIQEQETPGYFRPKQNVTQNEFYRLILRTFEEHINVPNIY